MMPKSKQLLAGILAVASFQAKFVGKMPIAREQTLALKAVLSKNPHAAEDPGHLRAQFPYVPPAEFKQIIRTAETVLHPRHIDQHFSDDAEITDLISAGLKKKE